MEADSPHPAPNKKFHCKPNGLVTVKTDLRMNVETPSQRPTASSVMNKPSVGGYNLRKPQRLTITVSWTVYQTMLDASDEQGRSLSNLAAYWLERQADCQKLNS